MKARQDLPATGLRSARLPQSFVRSQSLQGLHAQSEEARNSETPPQGPFSVVKETARYTMSDRIGRNYTPQARGLTMAGLKITPSSASAKLLRASHSTAALRTVPPRGSPLKTAIPSPSRAPPFAAWRPKQERKKADYDSWVPMQPEEVRTSIGNVTRALPPPHSVPHSKTVLVRGSDDFSVTRETYEAVSEYWTAIRTTVESDSGVPPLKQEWLENVNAMIPKHIMVSDALLREWYYDYVQCVCRSVVNYEMLQKDNANFSFRVEDLIQFPEWWVNEEYKCPNWRVLRNTQINRKCVTDAAGSILNIKDAHSLGASLKISSLSSKYSIEDTEYTEVGSKTFLRSLPAVAAELLAEIDVQSKQKRAELRDTWVKDAYAVLEHKIVHVGSKILSPGSANDDTKTVSLKGPLEDEKTVDGGNIDAAAGAELRRKNSLGGLQNIEDEIGERLLRNSVVQMRGSVRDMGDRTITSYVNLFEKFKNDGDQTGKSLPVRNGDREPVRISKTDVVLAALFHANGKVAFGDAVPMLNVAFPLGIFRIECKFTENGKVVAAPSRQDLQKINVLAINNIKTTCNSTMEDVTETLCSAVSSASLGVNHHIFSYVDGSDILTSATNRTSTLIDSHYNEIDTLVEGLRRYEYIFTSELDDFVEEICNEKPQGKDGRQKVANHGKHVSKALKALELKELCALSAVREFEAFDLFFLDASTFRNQISSRIKKLKTTIVKSYAKEMDEMMESICDEYSKIADRLLQVPEDSEDLKDLIQFFDDIQPRVTAMKDTVELEIFTMAKFLFAKEHIFDVRSMAHFWSAYGWRDEIEAAMERSIHIQNQEKIKREEILVSRRLYFEKELESLDRDAEKLKLFDSLDADNVKTYVKRLNGLTKMLENTLAEAASINEQENILKLDSGETDYGPRLKDLGDAIKNFQTFWVEVKNMNDKLYTWKTQPLWKQDAEEVDNDMDMFRRTFLKLEKDFNNMDMPDVADISNQAQGVAKEFLSKYQPLMALLCTRGLKKRHWDDINKLTGLFIPYAQNANLKQMIGYELHEHIEAITDTCINASKEFSLEQAMDKMEEEWQPLVFGTKGWKDTGTFILGSVEEVEQVLDDQIVRTQAMRGSRYIAPFIERCTRWEKILGNLEEILGEWLKVQSTWLYLEPIFSSEDIRKQMPMEAKRFLNVDRTWRDIMTGLQEDPSCINIAQKEGMCERLQQANKLLDLIQKGLSDYLNTKRVFFPRFFFLSNDELLEILSETKDPTRVLPHLKKCFEGVYSLEFQSDLAIMAMISAEKEKIYYDYEDISEKIINPNDSGGCVEIWLDQIQTCMRKQMALKYDQSMVDYGKREPNGDRTGWLKDWPGQIVLGVSQTYWTAQVTEALKDGPKGTKALHERLTAHLNDIIQMVRTPQEKIVKKTISPLCVLDVHARDTVVELEKLGIDDPNDFDWLCQFRYYWTEGGESVRTGAPGSVLCKMINAVREYAFEYLGNSMRLVVTPLTDRCYRTLMGAIHLDYGGAPAGPAGTGKTETVKDLGKNCAIQCVVYNCSDSLDYLAMGKFFKGLAGTGAWSCFDEFNRINLEVLSVIAQQILTITRAKVAKLDRFDFDGENIQLRRTCNVFITMNPGYAGRQELPDNLKALFRSVAMMVPDYAQIGQIILYSMGYLEGLAMARKIVMTYKLCSEQLSNQRHYDYGMRAVVAVLRASGNLKKKFPDAEEANLCLRSIIDVNLPKFLAPDVPLFKGIVGDLFPGVELEDVDYGAMKDCLLDMCKQNLLQPTDYFLKKVFEIYEMFIVRHGFMVVGLPFAGKSNALLMLKQTLTEMKIREPDNKKWQKVYTTIINPKSIPMGQLYGQFDPQTHEWSDGVLAISYRNFAAEPPKVGNEEDLKWVIFDGPVDAIWIENMNTVLDDNKKLCLMSGEMISMSGTMSMIFEPMDLEVASPATVSRVGVVYLEPHRMGWLPCVQSWCDRLSVPEGTDGGRTWSLPEDQLMLVTELFMWIGDPAICFAKTACDCRAPTVDQQLIVALLRLLEYQFDEILGEKKGDDSKKKKKNEKEKEKKLTTPQIESIFMFSLVYSVGSIMADASHEKFDLFLQEYITDPSCIEGAEYKKCNTQLLLRGWKYPFENYAPRKLALALPSKGSIYDYMYDFHNNKYVLWNDTLKKQKIAPDASFGSIVIDTTTTAMLTRLLGVLLTGGAPTLVVGPTGTGKSVFIKKVITKIMDQEVYKPIFLSYTAQTSGNDAQRIVDGKLDKRRKGVFGPAFGCKAVVFVDDINMPEVEEYGAQAAVELLRQMCANGGWYDEKEKTWRQLIDTQLISAMGPPGGSNNHITPRMMRHLNLLCVDSFSDEVLVIIFSQIVNWHMTTKKLPSDASRFAKPLVAATMAMYAAAQKNLLPTPAKSHYTFNVRDVARIVQGILLVTPHEELNSLTLPKLWLHECTRVISDRLVDVKDNEWFLEHAVSLIKEHFNLKISDVIGDLDPTGQNEGSLGALRRLFFGNYAHTDGKPSYKEISDVEGLVKLMEKFLVDYNDMSKTKMDLVLFVFAVEHISRIARVLSMPGGNMLLVGVGGSGRQSLTRMAAFMLDYELKQIELSKNYGMVEWREDVKYVLKNGGSGQRPFVFLFSDTQVQDETFIQDISSILNTGEVPNIFAVDEKMEIIDAMRTHAKELKNGKNMTTAELWDFFMRRCRDNLHIVLAFSPIGDAFRMRLRKFPSIINCSTIDWFFAWPVDALEAVAASFLKNVKLAEDVKSSIVTTCGYFHQSSRKLSARFGKALKRVTYMTPTSYLELVKAFFSSLEVRRDIVKVARDRYANGLEKLAFAAEQVETMQKELTDMIPVLEDSTKKTQALMATIEEKLPGVTKMKDSVGKEAAIIQVEADACAAMKKSCEDDLAVAIPLLEDAMNALNTLKPSDITEVKAMKTPPSGVVLVMSAVCDMMGVKAEKIKDPNDPTKKIKDYWGPSKKHLLGDTKFIQKLKDYDKDNIDPKIVATIRKKYISKDEFEPAIIKKASLAAMGLCKWVRAMEAYDRVAKVVAPKRAKLKESEESLAVTMEGLNKKKTQLKKVEDELAQLENALQEAIKRKDELEANVQLCNEKLVRAKELIDGLGGEQSRWSASVVELNDEYTNVTGNVLIASGIMAYLGPFTSDFRVDIVKDWVKMCKEKLIPCSDAPSLVKTLGDPVKIRQWQVDGLPTDSMSVDNGIILFNSRRWPLMIDPQGQANKWVRSFEKPNGLKIIKLSDANFMREVENAVQFGSPVLLENVLEEMDPTLEPVLQKAIFKQNGVMSIRLGDNTVEYSEHFRFYITTKLRNPHYLPEIAVKVTLLNFMITPIGLRDQLLACVVQEERPDLAEEKNRLIVLGAKNAALLKECEDKILHILATSSGNILEDSAAINALKESKIISNDIKEKQAVADETEKQIDKVRAGYVPVSIRGQILYFTIASLANIEPTYQYSLEWYTALFITGIQKAQPSKDMQKRLLNIIDFFSYSLYANVCRSLLEKDKLLFSFLMTVRLQQEVGDIDYAEWYFLITGGVVTENPHKNPAKEWLSDKAWGEICRIADLAAFPGLRHTFQGNASEWRHIYDSSDPENEKLPGDWDKNLGQFQKMLILRAIRPDKIVVAVRSFVMNSLGDRFVKPPPFDLAACYEDSSVTSPLVFVLSAGSDPMAGLLKFVHDQGNVTLHTISLGQGQGPKAEILMKNSMKDGSWVILQNCHLATSWMPSLERICEQLKPNDCKSSYRLWCTTYPSPDFPVSILQNAVKMTVEPPAGMRANIIGSYMNDPISDPTFFSSVKKAYEFRVLLYSLCFFHANIQERREFGALGWNNPYEFNESDLRITIKQLAMFLDLYDKLPFKALNYCTGQCNYGGRVTDDKDRRLLMTLLKDYFKPEVLEPGHKITKSGSYKMPEDGSYDSYVKFAQALPLNVDPEVFCLHENANMTKDQKSTNELFVSILLTEESGGGGNEDDDAKSPEQILFEVAKATREKFPEVFDMEIAKLKYPVKWDNSMNTVLVQELERFNALVNVITLSLKDIMDAVKGLTVMSSSIEKSGNSLFFGKVPDLWLDASYPSLKPMASYVTDLLERLSFFKKWLDKKAPPTFWVSGFYFTQAFLTGTSQNFARRYTVEIDDVRFDFEVMPKPQQMYRKAPKDGVYVYGLFIDGARWDADKQCLAESLPKVLFADAPVIWLRPKASKDLAVYQHYECPVYKTSERRGMLSTTGHSTNFVMMIRMPSDRHGDLWIKAGVAMLTQLDD